MSDYTDKNRKKTKQEEIVRIGDDVAKVVLEDEERYARYYGHKVNIVFMGGRQAGCVGLLTLLAAGYPIRMVVCNGTETTLLERLAIRLGLPVVSTIHGQLLSESLLVSVHGSEIVPSEMLGYRGGINVHPFPFKGRDPIGQLLEAGGDTVFLRAHKMTDEVDGGVVLAEEIVDVSGLKTREEVYNKLYPYYSLVLFDAVGNLI